MEGPPLPQTDIASRKNIDFLISSRRMNNNDFRALLLVKNSATTSRTTKEKAREVVEHEFLNKKRGGGGGSSSSSRRSRRQRSSNDDDDVDDSDGGGSSDDDAASNKDEKNKESHEQLQQPEWKRRRKEKKAATDAAPSAEYRDRAKERREGTNADYALLDVGSGSSSSLIIQPQSTRDTMNENGNDEDDNRKRRVELSKYLGGDEEHTHLVKGLDKALAEKVRREENTTRRIQSQQSSIDGALDLDEVLEDACNNTQKDEQQKSDWRSTKLTKTELGTSMLNYLLQKEQRSIHSSTSSVNPSAAVVPIQNCNISSSSSTLMVQRSIQQTVYNFVPTSNVHQRHVAWEVPPISILPTNTRTSTGMTSACRRDMNPLSKDIIMAIKKKLDSRASSSSSSLANSNEKSKYSSVFRDVSRKKKLTMKDKNREEETTGVLKSDGRYNDDMIIHDGESGGNNDNNDSDDDSDIFDNIGTYAPTQQEEGETD